MRASQMIGLTYGILTVIARSTNSANHTRLLCQCACGRHKIVYACNLRSGRSKSCGCQQENHMRSHGHYRSLTYASWRAMIQRCNNPNNAKWQHYGGRGITVAERWRQFENFLADIGPRPHRGYTLDRIDPDQGYGPENCRWADAKTQASNKRKHIKTETTCEQ
jgi:hypothetical protein